MPEHFAEKFLRYHQAIPLAVKDEELELAVVDPLDRFVANAVALTSGKRVHRKLALPSELDAAIERLYGAGRSVMARSSPVLLQAIRMSLRRRSST